MKNKGLLNRVGPPVRGGDFYGREKFVDLVWQKILKGNLLLAAPRRFGKTSIMYRLIDEPRHETIIVHADLEAVSEPADFVIRIVEELAKDERFDATVGEIGFLGEAFWNFFKRNFQEVDLYIAKVKLREQFHEDWQARGTEIFTKVAENDSRVIFIFDEFPMMLDTMLKNGRKDEAKNFLRWFRSLRQAPALQDKLRFIIAGSIGIDRILNELGEIASINDFEKFRLEPFRPSVAREFLNELCKTYEFELDEEITTKILEVIGTPIPFFIQILFSKLYESSFLGDEDITVESVERIYRDKVLGVDCKTYFEHYYGRLRQYYDPAEEKAAKKTLREIAVSGELKKDTCFQIYQKNIGKEADLEKFSGLMAELENDFYVTFNHEKDAFEFGSKLLRDWWLRNYGMTID